MLRNGLILLSIAAALTGCGNSASDDNPFAPGVNQNAEAVDPMLVGHRLMDAGEYELAIKSFSRAAIDDGMTGEVLLGLGSAYLALGRLGEAEELLRDSIERDETAPEAWNNLGVTLMEQGNVAEAAQVFRHAYALDNGESDSIRDNLRLALAKNENPVYDETIEQDYKVVRRGTSDFLIRKIP